MGWGGARKGSGPKKAEKRRFASPKRAPSLTQDGQKGVALDAARGTLPAEARTDFPAIDPRAWAMMLPEIEAISSKYAPGQRKAENNPFVLPKFPKAAIPKSGTMAMDNALSTNLAECANGWLSGDILGGMAGEGLMFPGYSYLAELAQRPEYRVMSETIADDATRKWIDFDVVGDEQQQEEERKKDPEGYDERIADPDQRKKRVEQSGKLDKVKALKDDQLRLEVKDRYYEQARNGGFFGRSHLFMDIWTSGGEPSGEELRTPIGDGRSEVSKTKIPKGAFKALRTIEPVWTYPMGYNAINPLQGDWYNPQVWYVMGREIHGSRIQKFIPHPVPDMLKPAYAFGGLSLTQMAKPYVDIWIQTRQSIADLIHSFSVMVLMTDLSTLMQPGNVNALLARVAMFNMMRDNQGTFVVNKNTEDFKNVSAQLGGLHELQSQAQEHMAAVHRIPLVKFTGIQPAGLNASSEGEIKVYDDTISAYQSRVFAVNLTRIINFEQLSLFGKIDPEITHRFEPLREITQAEKGTKEKDDADRDQKYVDMGAISPGEIRKIIIENQELPYTGLDPDDVPEPPAEEGLLGPGAGGAAKVDAEQADGVKDDEGGAQDSDFKEGDHPRSPDGKFGSGGSSIGSKYKTAGKPSWNGGTHPDPAKMETAQLEVAAKTLGHAIKNNPFTHAQRSAREERLADVAAELKKREQGGGANDADLPFVAADEAAFEEGKHPRAPDGKFTSGGGGGSSGGGGIFKSKKEQAAHMLSEGVTKQALALALGWPQLSMTATAKQAGMKLEKYTEGGEVKYKGTPFTVAEKEAMKEQAAAAKAAVAKAVENKPAPQKVEIKTPPPAVAKSKHGPATAAELEKAKKTGVMLKVQFVPNGATLTDNNEAKGLVNEFNEKWLDKKDLTPAQLQEKVDDFKDLNAAMVPLMGAAAKKQAEAAAQAKEQAAANAKKMAEAAAAKAKEAAQKNQAFINELGISETQAEGFAALAQMLGKTDLVEDFKKYGEQAKAYGYPISGFECALIKNYSDGGFGAVNAALRSDKWTPAQHVYVAMVNKALKAMPRYSSPEPLIRNTNLSPEQIAYYAEGHVIQEKALMSTSTKKPDGVFSGNVRFVVTSAGKDTRAASIKKLSNHNTEDEVVFAGRTYFKVGKVEKLSKPLPTGATTVIHLEEWHDL